MKNIKVFFPQKPPITGKCHNCGKTLNKATALWCSLECKFEFYGVPSEEQQSKWDAKGVGRATDGCRVESCGGVCEHGFHSWSDVAWRVAYPDHN